MKHILYFLVIILLFLNVSSTRTTTQTKTQTMTQAKTQSKTQVKTKAKTQVKAQAKAKAKSQAKAQAKSQAKSQAKAQAKSQVKVTAQAKSQAKSQAKVQAKSQIKAQAKSQAKFKLQATAQAKSQAKSKAQAKFQAKSKSKTSNKATTSSKVKLQTTSKSKSKITSRAKTALKTEAKTTTKTNTLSTSTTSTSTSTKTNTSTTTKTGTSTETNTETSTDTSLKSMSQAMALLKKQMKELERLREKGNNIPNIEQLRHLTPEQREELIKKAKEEDSKKVPIKNVPVYNLQGREVYWQGWVKYFHYSNDQNIDKPNHFYENPNFFSEVVKFSHKLNKGVDGNFLFIQDKYHFWAKLLPSGNFNILGSRKEEHNTLANNVENLNTDLIGYVHPTNNANGAIKDLGSFNEGHCISIETVVPDPKKDKKFNPRTQPGEEETWVICTDLEKEKRNLMSYIVSLKIKRQKEIDDVGLEEKRHTLSVAELMHIKPFTPKIERYHGRGASQDDGYWILLQDWSECSLKCGGGYKTQQWMCVPPKKHGKPCIGDAIRKKPCNLKPCPNVLERGLNLRQDKTHVTLKPIYRAMPYSKRPQQYIKCMIKENDVLYVTKEYDPGKKNGIKVPGRIVMNTKTISVYKDDGYVNLLFSFNLQDAVFSKSDTDYCCFRLTATNRQYTLCGFNNNCGNTENPIWVARWGYDFEYFQKKCYEELHETPKKLSRKKNNGQGGGNGIPLSGPQKEIVDGRRAIIQKKIQDDTQRKMDGKVGATQKIALTALRREINLEDLIKNEEIQKGRDETAQLFGQMKQEKKKKDLLEQALSSRESNYGKARIAKETQKKINDIKNDAKVDIKFKRGVLKKKIQEIRNKFRRKHRQIKQQIQMIRAEIAGEIMNANRRGNMEVCKDDRNNVVKIKEYCDKHYSDDYRKNMHCKDPQNFCYSCCETEFGNMFIAQREDCQTMCDELDKEDLNHGDWIWTTGTAAEVPKEKPSST